MEITPTKANENVQDLGVLKIGEPKNSQSNPANGMQTVFLPDIKMVKEYPATMSDDEINFDTHVNLRGNSQEDYHVNVEPNNSFQNIWKGAESYLRYGQEAMKLLAIRPDVALGFSKDITPEQLSNVYKPWADIWTDTMKEYPATKAVKEGVDKLLTKAPLPVAFAPWFVSEFVPQQLLEFGTKPINWVGAYGIEKLGPVVLNKALQMAPANVRNFLLQDIFKSEIKLSPDFEILGISPNATTSEVIKAWKTKAFETHPDKGGNANDFIAARKAFDNIMETRQTFLNKILDNFRPGQSATMQGGPQRLLTSKVGSADLVPSFEPGDLAKIGKDIVKVTNITGNMATVNLAGKAIEVGVDKLLPYKTVSPDAQEVSTLSPLHEEARKYKTAEEFVKAQTEGQRFHGTGKPIDQLSEYTYSSLNYYGQGFYTTDNVGIAEGYTKKGGKTPTMYKVSGGDKAKLYDMEAPLTPEVKKALEGFGEYKHILDESKNLREAFDNLREEISSDGNTADYVQEHFDAIRVNLEKLGYEGLNHVGGLKTGKEPHNVKIFWNPKELKLEPAQTKSQLTSIWNEANNPPAKPPIEPPVAGELGDINPDQPPTDAAVNIERMQIDEQGKQNLGKATKIIGDEIQNQTGKPITHAEVIEKAKESEILTKGVSREATLNFEAQILKSRQNLAALAEQPELTPEFLDALKIVANTGTDIARQLESFKISAMPEYATQKLKIIKKLQDLGIESGKIIKAAKGVDFKDQQQVAKFYRQFVKPTLPELLDEFAYMNILSSPKTHIVNTFSNLIQLSGLNPLTKLASGGVDMVASALTGADRTRYLSEIPSFYKGAINALPEAMDGALKALKGKTYVERPDIKNIPTLSKGVDYATLGLGKYVTRSLEASDIFFRTMIEKGEIESLSSRLGRTPTEKEMFNIAKEAKQRAEYYVFRTKPDSKNASGQGDVLSAIDEMTSAVYRLRDVPGAKWFIRFVQTPMNILKQGLEYSPAGFSTLKGAKDKNEQIGKAIIGSTVFAASYYVAMTGNSTWSLPRSQKERKLFYQSGRVPYSVKIGDRWVSYSKLGPLAYPLAMGAALNYYERENSGALSDSSLEKGGQALSAIMEFFSDQSYVQSLGDMLKTIQGDKQSISRMAANIPTQLIPLASLQRWVNGIVDPVYRKPEKGLSVKSIVENLMNSMIGVNQLLPAQKDIYGKPAKREDALLNAVSPLQTKKANESIDKLLKSQQSINQKKKLLDKNKEKLLENAGLK